MRTSEGHNLTYTLRETLGRAIVAGAFEDGFPTEAELSKTHGLSRSVTWEAVKMLAAKGLLSARPKIGTVVEVYLDGGWHLVDPTGLAPIEGLARIGIGRDAADISFMTIFGAGELRSQSVRVERID